MISAIEVLKANIPKHYDFIKPMRLTEEGKYEPDNSEKEFWDAVKEALLALEKQEELVNWLNFEIERLNKKRRVAGVLLDKNERQLILEEVKKRVGGQK